MWYSMRSSRPRYSGPIASARSSSSRPREDVVGHRRHDGVVALRRVVGLVGGGIVAGPERAGRAGGDLEALGDAPQPRGGAVDQHAPAAGLDAVAQLAEQRLPRAPRVAQQLLARLLALELAPHRELAPQPRHRDVVGAVAELAAQQRAPDLVVGLRAHRAPDPVARGHLLERRDVARGLLQLQHREPHAQARERGERPEAQQVQRRRERPRAALEEERHRGRPPLELVRHPELLVELGDVAVAREQVVVVALEQVAAADVDRRGLPAEAGPALVDVAGVARLGQPVRAHQARDAGADDRDPHRDRCGASGSRRSTPASAAAAPSSGSRFCEREMT